MLAASDRSRRRSALRLMDYATPTAETTFLVLPGFSPERPLGAALFDA